EAGKEMHGFWTNAHPWIPVIQDVVTTSPKLFRDDRCDGRMHPFRLGLHEPLTLHMAIRVVGAVEAFGAWILEEGLHGSVREWGTVSGSVSRLVEVRGHAFPPFVLRKELIHQFADRSFGWIHFKFFVLPDVAE